MKIKKPIKASSTESAAPAGGATIADRFKLEPAAAGKKSHGAVNKTAALCALIAAFAGLVVSGILTYVLYSHWDYLMPA
jgi:hypothetical protein